MLKILPLALTTILFSIGAVAADIRTVTLKVEGMHCGACPLTVRTLLKRQPGVEDVKVDAESRTADVRFDPDKVAPQALADVTAKAGYPTTIKLKP